MSNGYRHDAQPPTTSEIESWIREIAAFEFPDFIKPPLDAWEYVLAEFRKVRGLQLALAANEYYPLSAKISPYFQFVLHEHQCSRAGDMLRPEEYYSLATVTHAFFAWLFDKEGSDWLMRLFGVEEVSPHEGYRYWYGGRPHTDEGTLIGKETSSDIRIFIKNSVNRFHESAYEEPGSIGSMKLILQKLFKRGGKAPMFASDGMWKWVLGALRNWFTEPTDKYWPYQRADRINGMQWARNTKDPWSPTGSMWSAIEHTEKYRPRAYRIEQNGGVVWCGRSHIHSEPIDTFYYKEGVKAINSGLIQSTTQALAEKIGKDFRCGSCDKVLCCTTKIGTNRSGHEKICNNCYGTQIETGARDTLDSCTYIECFECPNYIRSTDDLKNLKVKMGQSYSWPVQR